MLISFPAPAAAAAGVRGETVLRAGVLRATDGLVRKCLFFRRGHSLFLKRSEIDILLMRSLKADPPHITLDLM